MRPALLLKVEPLLAIVPARIQAVLQFALLIEIVERPVAERDQDDDGDQGEKIAAPAGFWFFAAGGRLAHAMRLDARRSMPPSAETALATMPFASSPAAAYMRSGLS